MIVPSIDLMQGKAVKLMQGNPGKKKFEEDALALAQKFSVYPEVNLIDLDAALGRGDNLNLTKKVCSICNCNVGGGIRSIARGYKLLKTGANRLIIGTNACPDFLKRLPREKIIVAIDSRNGKVVDKGWQRTTALTPLEKVEQLENYCSGFLYTSVDREGTLQGIDRGTVKAIRQFTNTSLQYAGGIASLAEIMALDALDTDAVIGMAHYEKKIDLRESFVSLLEFEQDTGLIPTIVQDEKRQVLMFAYSSRESIKKALLTREGWYYSRSRQQLWKKGETSGSTQQLIRIQTDCDRDSLLFLVRQKKSACHTGTYSCFGNKTFTLQAFADLVHKAKGGLSERLKSEPGLLMEKIREEADEIIRFHSKNNLLWELADLLYFLTVLMQKQGIALGMVEKELEIRHLMKKYIKTTRLLEKE